MRHSMRISISKEPESGSGIMTCRNVSVRERILRFLFGKKQRLTVIVPGDTVDEIAIKELEEN